MINPGDKEHSFTKIIKAFSGSDKAALDSNLELYESVVEAAKVIKIHKET